MCKVPLEAQTFHFLKLRLIEYVENCIFIVIPQCLSIKHHAVSLAHILDMWKQLDCVSPKVTKSASLHLNTSHIIYPVQRSKCVRDSSIIYCRGYVQDFLVESYNFLESSLGGWKSILVEK